MEKPIAYKNEHGIWIYNRLPEGMKVAKKTDFINENGEIINGKKFLAQSFHFERLEAHTTNERFFIKWEPWLVANQIFIPIK